MFSRFLIRSSTARCSASARAVCSSSRRFLSKDTSRLYSTTVSINDLLSKEGVKTLNRGWLWWIFGGFAMKKSLIFAEFRILLFQMFLRPWFARLRRGGKRRNWAGERSVSKRNTKRYLLCYKYTIREFHEISRDFIQKNSWIFKGEIDGKRTYWGAAGSWIIQRIRYFCRAPGN